MGKNKSGIKLWQSALKFEKPLRVMPSEPPFNKEAEQKAQRAAISEAVHDLEAFLKGVDGKAARELLKKANKEIYFGCDKGFGGGGDIDYVLNSEGLKMKQWVGRRNPVISETSAAQCVGFAIASDFVSSVTKTPEGLMDWLRGELDKIAKAILEG